MQNEKVRFVSHPDDDHTPLNYEELVQAAKESHVALEVNNSSLIKKTDDGTAYIKGLLGNAITLLIGLMLLMTLLGL